MNKFIGTWKITEMEQWDLEYIDLVEPGYVEFSGDEDGEFVFGTVSGFMDCRHSENHGVQKVEFSWEGTSEMDHACGRGWFEIKEENRIDGWLFIHDGDDSWIKAEKKQNSA